MYNITTLLLLPLPFRHNSWRVGVYISDSLEYRVRDDLKFMEEGNENIWIEIIGKNSILNPNARCLTNIIVGVIYGHPSSSIKNFISNFEPTLQYLQNISSPFYITGDINIDLLSQSNNNVFLYNNLISSYRVIHRSVDKYFIPLLTSYYLFRLLLYILE